MRTFMFEGNTFNFYPYTATAGHEDEAERSPNGHDGGIWLPAVFGSERNYKYYCCQKGET